MSYFPFLPFFFFYFETDNLYFYNTTYWLKHLTYINRDKNGKAGICTLHRIMQWPTTRWWICTLIWFLCPSVKSLSYLIHPFYTCMSKLPAHTCTYGDPSPRADTHTPPSTPHSASPSPLCHVFDHGSQWRVWRLLTAPSPAVARPSAITNGWHSHRQLPPLP